MAVPRYLGILSSYGADSRGELEDQRKPHAAGGVGGVMRIDDVIGSVRCCIRAMEGYVPGKQLSGGAFIKVNTKGKPHPPPPRGLEGLRQGVGGGLRVYFGPLGLRLPGAG